MALFKSIDTPAGVSAAYWRITRVDFDVIARTVWFVLAGYASKETRNAGKDPLREQPFTMTLAPDATPEDIGRVDMYAFARSAKLSDQAESDAPMFEGATDA